MTNKRLYYARMHKRFYKSSRHNMYKSILENIPHDFKPDLIMSISDDERGGGPIVDHFKNSQIHDARFPEYDICNLWNVEDNTYECIVCDQVLEHVKNPFNAVNEMRRVLKPEGLLFLTTVFMYPIHSHPSDYWRFTPDALELLCEDFSKIVICDGWGNSDIIKIITDRREKKLGIPKVEEVSDLMEINNPESPLTTWIIAEK